MTDPTFLIRTLPIYGDLVLAPMSGYNDQPFRRLCREFGAALVYTGLIAVNALFYSDRPLGPPRSEDLLRFHPEEHPLVCQIFGSEVEPVVAAARRIQALGVDVLDLNIGCAEPKVTRSGAGAALLREPLKIAKIVSALVRQLTVPVTGKIRLGWDEPSRNYLEVARILEESGAALIAVHGRTAEQAYLGTADWDAIAAVKQAVRVPVLGSGDIVYAADIARMKQHTGCDAVMIGRAAIGNPWIFRGEERFAVSWGERVPVIRRHLMAMMDFHGPWHGVQRFRKHLRGYFLSSGVHRRLRGAMMACNHADQLLDMLEESAR